MIRIRGAATAALILVAIFSGAAHAQSSCTDLPTTAFDNFFPGYQAPPGPAHFNAALVNPPGTVSGNVDATNCSVGIYYGPGQTGIVDNATISNAYVVGILNDGANVTITHSTIHDLGYQPFIGASGGVVLYPNNGSPLGIGIYLCGGATYGCTSNSPATGDIVKNVIYHYQKNGITLHGAMVQTSIVTNQIVGLGPITRLSQNGIEIGYGAIATITGNDISANQYSGTGGATSNAVLGFGGDCFGTPLTIKNNVSDNVFIANDIGVQYINLPADCTSAVPTPTKNVIEGNVIRDSSVTNVSGATFSPPPNPPPSCANSSPCPYQAGIQVSGNADKIKDNLICGAGYGPSVPPATLVGIDTSLAETAAVVKGNKVNTADCN